MVKIQQLFLSSAWKTFIAEVFVCVILLNVLIFSCCSLMAVLNCILVSRTVKYKSSSSCLVNCDGQMRYKSKINVSTILRGTYTKLTISYNLLTGWSPAIGTYMLRAIAGSNFLSIIKYDGFFFNYFFDSLNENSACLIWIY